jgi:hypothetical protein
MTQKPRAAVPSEKKSTTARNIGSGSDILNLQGMIEAA